MVIGKKIFRNSFTLIKNYPRTDLESDHIPLISIIRIKLKGIQKKANVKNNTAALKDPIKQKIKEKNNKNIQRLNINTFLERIFQLS